MGGERALGAGLSDTYLFNRYIFRPAALCERYFVEEKCNDVFGVALASLEAVITTRQQVPP